MGLDQLFIFKLCVFSFMCVCVQCAGDFQAVLGSRGKSCSSDKKDEEVEVLETKEGGLATIINSTMKKEPHHLKKSTLVVALEIDEASSGDNNDAAAPASKMQKIALKGTVAAVVPKVNEKGCKEGLSGDKEACEGGGVSGDEKEDCEEKLACESEVSSSEVFSGGGGSVESSIGDSNDPEVVTNVLPKSATKSTPMAVAAPSVDQIDVGEGSSGDKKACGEDVSGDEKEICEAEVFSNGSGGGGGEATWEKEPPGSVFNISASGQVMVRSKNGGSDKCSVWLLPCFSMNLGPSYLVVPLMFRKVTPLLIFDVAPPQLLSPPFRLFGRCPDAAARPLLLRRPYWQRRWKPIRMLGV